MTLGQGQEMTLTFSSHIPSLTQLGVFKINKLSDQNQKQNSLVVKRQNDNTSAGLGRGRLVPSFHKGSEF